jgi:hypothetical protein
VVLSFVVHFAAGIVPFFRVTFAQAGILDSGARGRVVNFPFGLPGSGGLVAMAGEVFEHGDGEVVGDVSALELVVVSCVGLERGRVVFVLFWVVVEIVASEGLSWLLPEIEVVSRVVTFLGLEMVFGLCKVLDRGIGFEPWSLSDGFLAVIQRIGPYLNTTLGPLHVHSLDGGCWVRKSLERIRILFGPLLFLFFLGFDSILLLCFLFLLLESINLILFFSLLLVSWFPKLGI